MKYYIFRNNTVEPFFSGSEYSFSGYDDISCIPEDADVLVWFYQVPIKFDRKGVASEIDSIAEKLQLVMNANVRKKPIIIFTLENLFEVRYTSGDFDEEEAIVRFNSLAMEMANQQNVKVVDFGTFCRQFTSEELIDWKFYFISQMGLNPRLSGKFRKWWDDQLRGIALKRKKCLVLDLDNTLWGGILGEDGKTGIKIGGDYPGKAFLYFQEGLKELARNGVILAICSKNNEHDVLEAWRDNPFMVLTKEDFASYRINWTDKASNIAEIANELNIGLDSIVFIDDNPTERELVRQILPAVEVPDFPEQPYMLPDFLRSFVEKYFSVYSLTKEDRDKTEQYKANAARAAEKSRFVNLDDYIRSLGIQIRIIPANDFNLQRIAQMTQKTNQFNLTTHRLEESEVKAMREDGWGIWCISVSDRFGDNGITGAVFVDDEGNIDNLLLSCRILGTGIEIAFMKEVLNILSKRFDRITARYIPSAKNSQVRDFYEKIGFSCISEQDGTKEYQISLSDYRSDNQDIYNIIIE